MKRLLPLAITLFAALPALAGYTYDFTSATSGASDSRIEGHASVEGTSARVEMTNGDGMLFKDGAVLLSNDGGHTINVMDPQEKTYYVLALDQIIGDAGKSIFGQLGSMVDVKISDPKVSVRDGGNGPAIEGYPTHKWTVDSSYTINISVMGQKMAVAMSSSTDSWTTDKVPADAMNVFLLRATHSGVSEIDKLLAAQTAVMAKGFPLKQVVTMHILQNGNDTTTTTTMLVKNLAKKSITPAELAMPAGYQKVDSPIESMLKTFGGH